MTTSPKPYQPPEGFFKGYTFDKTGQVFADGKALNGVKLDVNSLAYEQPSTGFRIAGSKPNIINPFATDGGVINRLNIDDNGNVFGQIGLAPSQNASTGNAFSLPKISSQPSQYGQLPEGTKNNVEITGLALDPARTSRAAGGSIGDNQLYLRADDSGAYFAQVNKGRNVAAYAYSAINPTQTPVGGPEASQSNRARRQGGNIGTGVSSTSDNFSLLGD